jgi:hypothetical protein
MARLHWSEEEGKKKFRRRGITQKKTYNKENEHFEDLDVEGYIVQKVSYLRTSSVPENFTQPRNLFRVGIYPTVIYLQDD